MFDRERTIEVDLDKTDLFAFLDEIINNFSGSLSDRAHRNDDLGGFAISVVDKRSIGSASRIGNLLEVFRSDIDNAVLVEVLSFTTLESDIVILSATSGDSMSVRVQSSSLEVLDGIHIENGFPEIIVDEFDILNLVRGSETIEEVNDRGSGFNCD